MIVYVTADDIARGIANDCNGCAVARALRRAGLIDPTVTVVNIKFVHPNNPAGAILSVVDTPPDVADWIEWYDGGNAEYAIPFSFQIPVMPPDAMLVRTYGGPGGNRSRTPPGTHGTKPFSIHGPGGDNLIEAALLPIENPPKPG